MWWTCNTHAVSTKQRKSTGDPESARALGHLVPVLCNPLRGSVWHDEVELGGERDPELHQYGECVGHVGVHDDRRRLEWIHARLVGFSLETSSLVRC